MNPVSYTHLQDLLRVGNFTFMISVEGTPEETDARRGEGTYDKVMKAMKLLKDAGIPFGYSLSLIHICDVL